MPSKTSIQTGPGRRGTSTIQGKKALGPLLLERISPRAAPLEAAIWIQAVSVGEVEIASTFVQSLHRVRPDLSVLVTASTPAGVALLEHRYGARSDGVTVRPFPLDLPFSVRRFFDASHPRLLVLVETELWPAVLAQAERRGVPVLLASARLSERSARRYQLAGRFLRRRLRAITHVSARSDEDAQRFAGIGVPVERIRVGGDMKFDREPAPSPSFGSAFHRLAAGRPVLVAGSMADEEIDFVLALRQRVLASGIDLLVLLGPRRPESFATIARQLERSGLSVARRSELVSRPFEGRPDLFLLDTLGELAGAYGLGSVALLGGTFVPKGGHNVLEPLRAGLPTLHGPSTSNIRAALHAAGGAAVAVSDPESAARETIRLLRDPQRRAFIAREAQRLFERNAGATGRAVAAALALLGESDREKEPPRGTL